MKIVFDAYWWFEGPISNRNVMQEILREWRRRFPQDVVHVITDPRSEKTIAVDLDLPAEQVHAVRIKQHGLAVMLEYPWVLRRINADHILTHNFVPPFTRRASAFVHDLIFVTSPHWFTRAERIYFSLMTRSLKYSSLMFCSTRTEAARIENLAGTHGDVHPVGLAVSTELAAAVPRMPDLGLKEYGYSLIVGRLNERKNLAYGLALLSASGVISPTKPVVVVGEKHGKAFALPAELASLVTSGAIKFVGFMEQEELAWLYSKARLVVFPTLDEGFGLPVVEARYFGAPLALSDIPVLREVAGDAEASFFSLGDKDVATATLASVRPRISPSKDAESRSSVTAQYSWENTVDTIRRSILKTKSGDTEHLGGL